MSRNYFDLGMHQQDLDDEAYDQGYREDVREERRELAAQLASEVRVECPNPSCMGGKVEISDGSPFPSLALCGMCAGRGYVIEERR